MKKLACSIVALCCSIQPLNAIVLSKDTIMHYLSHNQTLLRRSAIVGGIGCALYQTFKKITETEEKQIAVFNDEIVIKQITSKYLPSIQTAFRMHKQDQYIGLIISMNFGSQRVLGNLTIAKNSRNMGYGKLLLNTAVDTLIEGGCKEIYLDADPCEQDAKGITSLPAGSERTEKLQKLIHFYEKNGFEAIDRDVAKKKVAYFNAIDLSHPMQYKRI